MIHRYIQRRRQTGPAVWLWIPHKEGGCCFRPPHGSRPEDVEPAVVREQGLTAFSGRGRELLDRVLNEDLPRYAEALRRHGE